MAPSNEEREMTTRQLGLVDTCFEEGQYQSGIALLDQLRSPSFKPCADHIRQLLYIALFPPPPPAASDQQEQLPPSPIKGSPTKQRPALSRTSLSPSVADSAAAQRVLFSFLATNSPASLFRALPSYPLVDAAGSTDIGRDQDSLIARESLCIKDSKICWAILREGFIQRKMLLPPDARKKRTRSMCDVQDAHIDQSHEVPAAVAEHAWPILQWLLSLFEKDERLGAHKSGENFSLLLLSLIPPPRGGTGPRWDSGASLDIVFHAIDQEDGERREMAARLLALLINLCLSPSFHSAMFASTLSTRLYTSPPQIVQNLMECLPRTVPILTFKISLCQKCLSSTPSSAGGSKVRPRPLRRGQHRDSETASFTTENDAGRSGPGLTPRPALPTYSEISQLLCCDYKPQNLDSEPPVHAIKYTLLTSYAHLQSLLSPGERDSEWEGALSNGGLKHVIDTAFPGDSTYHAALTMISILWSPS